MSRDYEWYDLSRCRSEVYGIGILWIMLFHFKGTYPVWAKAVLSFGNMGVELFLFASGVSLYFTMQKKEPLSVYYGRRLLRLLLPVILICSWQFVPSFVKGKIGILGLLSRWTALQFWLTGQQQIWFVSFLLVAYLLYPFFYSYLYENGGNPALRTLVLAAGSAAFAMIVRKTAPSYYELTETALTRFPVFILGCAAGKAVYEKKTVKNGKVPIIVCLALITAASFAVMGLKLVTGTVRRYFYLIPGVALSLLLPALVSLLRTALKHLWAAMRYLGDRSLELYLLHIMLNNHLLKNVSFYDRQNVLHYYLLLAVCVLLAWPAHAVVGWLRKLLTGSPGSEHGAGPQRPGGPAPEAELQAPETDDANAETNLLANETVME